MSLQGEAIVTAAIEILDEYGLADLSMRRVAEALGVKAGALYWHVPNKQGLLAAVADRLLATLPAPAGSPEQALLDWADQLRSHLLAHRDSAELVATALASGLCTVDPLAGIREMLASSRSLEEAEWGARALLHLVLGHLVEEQNAQLFHTLVPGRGAGGPVCDGVVNHRAFTYGVQALVSGLLIASE